MAHSRPTSWDNALNLANSFPSPMERSEDTQTVLSSTISDAGDLEGAAGPPSGRRTKNPRTTGPQGLTGPVGEVGLPPARPVPGGPTIPTTSHRPVFAPPDPASVARKHLSTGSMGSQPESSRPTTGASRSHVPTLTSRAFFQPMSSQRLQAYRGQRPVSFHGGPAQTESDDSGDENRTDRNSLGSAPTDRGRTALPRHPHEAEVAPPVSRDTERSEWQPREAMATNAGLINDNIRYEAAQSVPSVDGTGGPTKSNFDSEKANASGTAISSRARSPRSYVNGFRQPSKQDLSRSLAGQEKLSSTDSSSLDKPIERPQQPDLGRNWEYFEGNTLFFFGGRLQTAKSRPIALATATLVVVPSILFFVFSYVPPVVQLRAYTC